MKLPALIIVSLTLSSHLHAEINSYYPVLTEPGYEDSSIEHLLGDEFRETRLNLTGIDPDTGKLITPLISGFSENNPIRITTRSSNTTLSRFTDEIDWCLKDDYLTALRIKGVARSEDGRNKVESSLNYTHQNSPIINPRGNPGKFELSRKIVVGEIIYSCAFENSESLVTIESPLGTFTDPHRSNAKVETSQVIIGTDEISTLVPGSEIPIITGSFEAIVVVSETSKNGTCQTFLDGELFQETPFSTSSTLIEWRVKGFGRVRSRAYSGSWLFDILDSDIYQRGRTGSKLANLNALIPLDFLISEKLRSGGGSALEAQDTFLTSDTQELELWRPPPFTIFQPAEEAGLDGQDALITADPNRDGINNGIAYALGIPLTGKISTDERARVPQSVISPDTGLPGLTMMIPEDAPDDVTLCIETSPDLASTSWTEIARKVGDEEWTGTAQVTQGSAENGFVPIVFEGTQNPLTQPVGFMRLRIELSE